MRELGQDSSADMGRRGEEGQGDSARRGSRRRFSAEEKARVVRESFRPGKLVGEVARRYGVSRWQLSTWRSLARAGKLAVPMQGPSVDAAREASGAYAALQVEPTPGPVSMESVEIEARGVTVRVQGEVAAQWVSQVALSLQGDSRHRGQPLVDRDPGTQDDRHRAGTAGPCRHHRRGRRPAHPRTSRRSSLGGPEGSRREARAFHHQSGASPVLLLFAHHGRGIWRLRRQLAHSATRFRRGLHRRHHVRLSGDCARAVERAAILEREDDPPASAGNTRHARGAPALPPALERPRRAGRGRVRGDRRGTGRGACPPADGNIVPAGALRREAHLRY